MFGGWLVSLVVGLFTFCLLVCLFSGWLVSLVVGLFCRPPPPLQASPPRRPPPLRSSPSGRLRPWSDGRLTSGSVCQKGGSPPCASWTKRGSDAPSSFRVRQRARRETSSPPTWQTGDIPGGWFTRRGPPWPHTLLGASSCGCRGRCGT